MASRFAKFSFSGGNLIRIALSVRRVILEGPAVVIIIEIWLGMIDDGMLIIYCDGDGMMQEKQQHRDMAQSRASEELPHDDSNSI